jgi:D-arabinose 1-dehydrogenase-like Zn-dependent alcohol dehydrogenase
MGYRMIAIDAGHLKGNVCWKLGAEIYIGVLQTKDLSATVNEKTKGCNASAVLVAAGNSMAYQAALFILAPSHVIGRWLRGLQTSGKYAIEFFEAGDDPESS